MRILFITSNRIGDAVLSNGVLQALLDDHPGARVTVAAGGAAASLYRAVPGLERIISVSKRKFHGHWIRLWAQTVLHRWDVVVDMRRSGISYCLWARRRLIVPAKNEKLHRVVELSAMLDGGRGGEPPAPVIWTGPGDEDRAAFLIPNGQPPRKPLVLAVGPAANWHGKQWPAERFAELIKTLTESDGPLPGASVAVFAAPHERAQILPVLEALPAERTIDLVGKVDLVEAAACLKRCKMFIGNDSGLMHLAAATGIKTLGLFGPSPEWRYHPWGENCAWVRTPEGFNDIVNHPDYDRHKPVSYMESLSLESVVSAAIALYKR